MGDKRNVCRVLVGKPAGKRPLRRHRRRFKDNIKTDLREIELGVYGLQLIGLRTGTSGRCFDYGNEFRVPQDWKFMNR
jgi:hypothetical protein